MLGVGQRIGNYRVRRKLGQGGMGAVYEVMQEEIGRRAAIKILHLQYAKDTQSIQRFFNEARAVNIIHHAGLVGIFESGRLEDGGAYIVMEFLDGELLSNRLSTAGAMAQHQAINFGRQIASALAAAHAKQIVHRDLKPDNIMIVPDSEAADGERVKIFDFGIAKLRLNSLSPDAVPKMLKTQTGMIMGTPTHMAPEQCRGASGIDGKADVYSLGVIMFQMLVGHLPFMAENVSDLLSMHLRDRPPSPRKLDPSIPKELSELVVAMLSKEAEGRPEMAEIETQFAALSDQRPRRTATKRPAPSSNSERPKPRGALGTLQQAVGQTLQSTTSRSFLIAIVAAVLLVMVSGTLLFEDKLPSFSGAPESPSPPAEVSWFVDSDPPGAAVVRADTSEVLGVTPWSHTEPEHGGNLRVFLQRAGYHDTTVVLNHSLATNQKVQLQRIDPTVTTQFPAPKESEPELTTAIPRPPLPKPVGKTARSLSAPIIAGHDKPLRWEIASRPLGASVIRPEDGQVVGKTPWTLEQPPRSGILKLLLRLPGHRDSSVILDLSSGTKHTVVLQPLIAPSGQLRQ